MNLAALWTHERARVCADGVGHALPTEASHHHYHADDRRTLKRQPSNSTLSNSNTSTTASPATCVSSTGGVKKKPSIAAVKRESVFTKLVEASALPSTAGAQFFDSNEFAMEYADRAPKRFLQQATHAVEGTNASCDHASTGGDGAVHSGTKPVKHKASGLAPVSNGKVSDVTAAAVTANAALSSQATVSKVSSSVVAAVVGGLPRRNPRKRGGNGTSLELAHHTFRPYVGDMFSTRGDYVEGMLYMSRMKRSRQLTFGHDGSPNDFSLAGRSVLKDAVSDAFSAAVAAAAVGNLAVSAGDGVGLSPAKHGGSISANNNKNSAASAVLLSEISPEDLLQLRQRQRCSLTLSNWSSNPENARLMVEENVVKALILLCKASDGDRVTTLHCVTTFMNLSHVDELRSEIVQQGAVKTLVDIANEAEDEKTLRTACAITLCNLCCCQEGEEEILVEDGAVSALSLLINEHPKTSSICLGALFNLTCVKEPYHKIESVLKVFLTLASTPSSPSSPNGADRDGVIAKAICNLSNFKRVRLRLMEEGIVSAVSNLIHPGNSDVPQLLAYVLLNLSAMRACRGELVAKGCIGVLVALTGATSAQDGEAKCLIGMTLWNLSKEPGNRLRMVFEGLLLLVNELCRTASADNSGEAVRAVCARTVYNVSCSEETRVKLVERDAVSVLSSLSQRCTGDDGKKMCTLALCNLLSVQQAASDIVTAGAITSLIHLSKVTVPQQTLETRQLFSKALYGLCEMASTRAAVVHEGIIPAIIYLSSASVPSTTTGAGARQAGLLSEIRARCTAALACLAADDTIAPYVSTPDVVRCVIRVLIQERFNVAIERFCCSCLSLLCRDEQCSLIVADEGAIQAVLSTCLESHDLETKASCCHVLASMSCHRSCCMALVNMGVLPVLTTLAKTASSNGSGATVQRCCAITLANLSAEKEIRSILVTSSIVPLLSLLSNSYSEDSQRDCARVLCNLSSVEGYEAVLVREGALGVLMMISMVRALQPATKETCLRAFANLLTHDTVRAMVAEGIVKVLPTFAGLASNEDGGGVGDPDFASSVVQVVSVLYAKLLQHEEGRHTLQVERASLRALVNLRPGREQERALYENLLNDIIFYSELRERSVDAGIVEALQQLAMLYLSRGYPVSRISMMLYTLAEDAKTRQAAASPSGLVTLEAFLNNPSRTVALDKDCVLYSVSAVCHLVWNESTSCRIGAGGITSSLTRLLRLAVEGGDDAPPGVAIKTCLLTLCCVSYCCEHLAAMLQEDVMTHLYSLMETDSAYTKSLLALVCILFRQISHAPAFVSCLMKSSAQTDIAIKLFCLLANRAAAEGDQDAALDCADTLCSVTFIPPISHQANNSNRPAPFVRRQSQPQLALRGSMTATSSIPPVALVTLNVLEAIRVLMSGDSRQAGETRWRCTAALYAFSCIVDYRHTLVRLGCTRLLVKQATSAAHSTSAVDLATLKCCAGALCNLTIVSGSNADANAQKMVEEDAVPALIQLAKLENEEIREHCTLALSNLSMQSPKVESGAVSALLALSLRSGLSHGAGHVNAQAGASRPPPVVNVRYKEIASLPEYHLQKESQEDLLARKYEAAQGHASKPAPPHLPVISPDISMVGGLGRASAGLRDALTRVTEVHESSVSREEVILRRLKSSSIGNLMGMSPTSTPLSRSSSSCGDGETVTEGEIRGWQTKSFPKIDPVESRALNMDMEEDDADPAEADDANANAESASEVSSARTSGRMSGRELGENEDSVDARSESEDTLSEDGVGKSRLRASGAANGLSPLARVVVRKTQTSTAVNKLKDLRSNLLYSGSRSGGVSSSSLPLATVNEAHEPSTLSHRPSNKKFSVPKPTLLQKLGSLKSLYADDGDGRRKSESNLTTPEQAASAKPAGEEVEEGAPVSPPLAAAAAAAMLYSAGPTLSPADSHPKMKAKSSKPTKKKTKTKQTPFSHAVHEQVEIRVATIEDVQTQVKLLGLWS